MHIPNTFTFMHLADAFIQSDLQVSGNKKKNCQYNIFYFFYCNFLLNKTSLLIFFQLNINVLTYKYAWLHSMTSNCNIHEGL